MQWSCCPGGPPRHRRRSGLGGLRGVVTDNQGGALPGVTVIATAPEMLGPQTAVTNEIGRVPAAQPAAGHLHAHRRADRIRHLPAAGHPDSHRVDLPGGHDDAAVDAAGDHHRHRRLADDRGGQGQQRPQHRRRVPAVDADPGAPQLQRLPRAHPRGDLARVRRRQRPPGLLRPCHRALRARAAARGHHRQQLPRRAAHLRVDGRRHGLGHPGEDRRRRRRVADGHRPGDEHHHQERRQRLPRQWRVRLRALRLERQQRRQLLHGAGLPARHRRHADHRLRAPVRRRAGWPADARQGVVLRGAAPRAVVERHQPHRGRGRPHRGLSGQRRALRQRLGELAAVRQGHQPVRPPRHAGVLPARSAAAHRRPGIQLRADHDPVDRRVALQRQDHLGVGSSVTTSFTAPTTTRAATTPRPSTRSA